MKIIEIQLYTNNLEEVESFYHKNLELKIASKGTNHISFNAGTSTLTFIQNHLLYECPFYHFAFSIPEKRFKKAYQWLKERINLPIDVDGNDIVHSQMWNTNHIYFNDSVGNIVEFISRTDLNSEQDGEFSTNEIINITEIGVPVGDVYEFLNSMEKEFNLSNWKTAHPSFTAIGDENGLLITVKEGRVWYMSDKEAKPYYADIIVEGLIKKTFQPVPHIQITSVKKNKP